MIRPYCLYQFMLLALFCIPIYAVDSDHGISAASEVHSENGTVDIFFINKSGREYCVETNSVELQISDDNRVIQTCLIPRLNVGMPQYFFIEPDGPGVQLLRIEGCGDLTKMKKMSLSFRLKSGVLIVIKPGM